MHTPITHTLIRNGSIFVNRRVPKRAREGWGSAIRAQVPDIETAKLVNERLTALFSSSPDKPIPIPHIIESCRPADTTLGAVMADYLSTRSIVSEEMTKLGVGWLVDLAGDLPIEQYTRSDARRFAGYLQSRGLKTSSVRRYLAVVKSVLNFGYVEHEIDKRNPFASVRIAQDGEDRKPKAAFTAQQLQSGYGEVMERLSNESVFGKSYEASLLQTAMLFPLLGETGCRLAEIVGLRSVDIDIEKRLVHIRPHSGRRLKNKGSERTLPLVGTALSAAEKLHPLLNGAAAVPLFPRFVGKDGRVRAATAGMALNRWIQRRYPESGLTVHSLRHTFRDRLRAVECPIEAIDQLGGWSSFNNAGSRYGLGYDVEHLRRWVERIAIEPQLPCV